MEKKKTIRLLGLILGLFTALSLLAACSGPAVQSTQATNQTSSGAVATQTTNIGTVTQAPITVPSTELPATGGTQAPSAELPSTGGTQAPTGAFVPPAGDVCQKMADDVQATLGVDQKAVKVENSAPFQDPKTNVTGTGCQITITAKGSDLAEAASLKDVTDALNVVLQSAGWKIEPSNAQNNANAQTNPNSSSLAVRQGNILALVNAGVQAAPEANCPADQPIASCQNAKPEQLTYTVTVNVAQQGQ